MRTEVGQLDPALVANRRLVIEQVELRRRARLEEVDHPLGPGCEMRQARQTFRAATAWPRRVGGWRFPTEQRPQRDRSQAEAGATKKVPAVQLLGDLKVVHEKAPRCERLACGTSLDFTPA